MSPCPLVSKAINLPYPGAHGVSGSTTLNCGEQWDADLGLYFLRARYLDVNSGRFWSMDSWGGSLTNPLSFHKYSYANLDPVNNSDPSGNFALKVAIGILVGAVLATMAIPLLSLIPAYESTHFYFPGNRIKVNNTVLVDTSSGWTSSSALTQLSGAHKFWVRVANVEVTSTIPEIDGRTFCLKTRKFNGSTTCPLTGNIRELAQLTHPLHAEWLTILQLTLDENGYPNKMTTIFTKDPGDVDHPGLTSHPKPGSEISFIGPSAEVHAPGFVTAHEWGHAFGLGHSHTAGLMYNSRFDYNNYLFIREMLTFEQIDKARSGAAKLQGPDMKNILSSTKAKFLAVSCLSLTFLGGILLFPNPITQEWLFGAVENGDLQTTQLLITLNPKLLYANNENGQTPLHLSVSTGENDLSMIQFLILKGGNVDQKNQNGYTSLHIAAARGNLFLAEYLIQNGASVNGVDKVGDTPLHDAVRLPNKQMAEFLIQKGGNVNAKNSPYQETPLHYAVRVNKLESVKLLISNGADIDSPNYIGATPLDLAKNLDRGEIIQELEKAKGLISKHPDYSSKSITSK